MMLKPHKKTGFTLVEMLIVFAILGILSGIMLMGYHRPALLKAYEAGARYKMLTISKIISVNREHGKGIPSDLNEENMKANLKISFSDQAKYTFTGSCKDDNCMEFTLVAIPKIKWLRPITYESSRDEFKYGKF